MMTSNRPTGNLSIPSSSSAADGSVQAGGSLRLLYKELSSVADRELAPPATAEGESASNSFMSDSKAATAGSTAATNVMIVKTIRTAMAEMRRP